jgi:uncharacterized protein (DUF2147 family)
MKVFSSFTLLMLLANIAFAQVKPDDICGIWLTEDSRGKMEIFKNTQNNTYEIKVVWQKNSKEADGSEKLDKKNPKPELRKRTLQGMVFATGLKWDADDKEWYGGDVYNPEDGNMYSCKARLDGNRILRFRGYLWVSLLGKTTTWYRTVLY